MSSTHIAVFGGGCFWCTEAVFKELKGIESVVPGYAGGSDPNPTYERVSTGETGHAEVVRIAYDPMIISYRELLTILFAVHDPTTLNRQGADIGTQYRSIILTSNNAQTREAEAFIRELDPKAYNGSRITTEVKPLDAFHEAEPEHHDYFLTHPDRAYCSVVIAPKLKKFRDHFSKFLK